MCLSSLQARHQMPLFLIALKRYWSQGRLCPKAGLITAPPQASAALRWHFPVHWKMLLVQKFMAWVQMSPRSSFNHSHKYGFTLQMLHWQQNQSFATAWPFQVGNKFLAKISPVNWIPTSHQSQQPAQMRVRPWICLQQSNPLILVLLWLFLTGKFLHMNHYTEPFCLPACYWTIQEAAFKCKKVKQQYWLSFVWVYLIL